MFVATPARIKRSGLPRHGEVEERPALRTLRRKHGQLCSRPVDSNVRPETDNGVPLASILHDRTNAL